MDTGFTHRVTYAAGRAFNLAARALLWAWDAPERNLLRTPPVPHDSHMTGLGWAGATLRARPFAPPGPRPTQLDHTTVHENINPHPRRVALDDEFTPIGRKQ